MIPHNNPPGPERVFNDGGSGVVRKALLATNRSLIRKGAALGEKRCGGSPA
jgi:hypothetical protein